MRPLSTDDLRQTFLDFFADHEHAVIPGAPLIPENDPTVLFTTAGMHPLVPYLLGGEHPEGKRLADCQKCVRTQDIDEVGDESHLTFFEMLGNWSLGDYFKEGAIRLSFEFLTEVLGIPVEKLAVSCFGGDDRFPDLPRDNESAKLWKEVGIPEDRIGFITGGVLESDNNWWGPAGQTGPCGPDTEIFVWVHEREPKGNPETHPDGWLEIWNDVFMEYNKVVEHPSTGSGRARFEKLARKNVDTGMGLERVAAVMQGVWNVYETDRLNPILKRVQENRNTKSETRNPKHERIIADHLRAATFIIADGVRPSNVDQGYVLRKLIRRAIRSARQLGIENVPFTPLVAEIVIQNYGHVYGNLKEKEKHIRDTLAHEEEQFSKTLKEGLKHFEKAVHNVSGNMLDGITTFHLYDTYGFPLELTKEMAAERKLKIDEKGFKKAFEEHQKLSRKGAQKRFAGGLADHSAATTKLHTATHLLNAALRKVLGDHVEQKGSNITRERLRFDFNHPEKMSPADIVGVERLVNDAIAKDLPVSYHITTVEDAKQEGTIGVFEEKYGEEVKVYVIGPSTGSGRDEWSERPFSREICGGPHVARTGMIGRFTILKEESSSAGIRRIRAIVEGGPRDIEVAKEE